MVSSLKGYPDDWDIIRKNVYDLQTTNASFVEKVNMMMVGDLMHITYYH